MDGRYQLLVSLKATCSLPQQRFYSQRELVLVISVFEQETWAEKLLVRKDVQPKFSFSLHLSQLVRGFWFTALLPGPVSATTEIRVFERHYDKMLLNFSECKSGILLSSSAFCQCWMLYIWGMRAGGHLKTTAFSTHFSLGMVFQCGEGVLYKTVVSIARDW